MPVSKWSSNIVACLENLSSCRSLEFHFSPKFEIDEHIFGHLHICHGNEQKSINEILCKRNEAQNVSPDKFETGEF